MKLIILPLLCMGIAYVSGQCDIDGAKPEGCYDDPNIAKIECLGQEECHCNPEDQDVCTAVMPDTLTAAEMDGQKCKEICEASKLLGKCEFYRWEEDFADSVHCSLMDDTQCKSYEPCTGVHCKSGQAACQSGPEPGPTGENCKSGADFVPGNIHWKCINPFDETQARIDIYAPVEDIILPGTICYTERKCKNFDAEDDDDATEDLPDFLYHTFVVQCNEIRDDSGLWANYEKSSNDPTDYNGVDYIGGGLHLTDPPCDLILDDLKLDKKVLTESGVSFICSEGGNLVYDDLDVIVKNPNTCALLCNFHHVMTIEPKDQENEGTSKWWKYTTGDDEGEEATRENVFCWSPPVPPL